MVANQSEKYISNQKIEHNLTKFFDLKKNIQHIYNKYMYIFH